MSNTQTFPVVDLSAIGGSDADAELRAAAALIEAAETLGFAVVGGHGINPQTGTTLHETATRFFDLPMAEKLAVRRPRNDQNRGYIPYGEETLVRMSGGESPPDYKEVFAIGPDSVPDEPYFTGPASYPSFAPNLWPSNPVDLRTNLLSYWRAMEALMVRIGEALAIGLELPRDTFAPLLNHTHSSQLRLLHYPEIKGEVELGQLRAGEHSDVGMMTILRNDPVPGGLQVKCVDDSWVDAPAIQNTYILNIGDLLMRWTNDRLRSTAHRVAIPPRDVSVSTRRLSIGFFVGPRYDAMVECLPTCHGPGNPPRYEPVSVHDYRTSRFAAGAGDNQPYRAA